MKRMTSKQRGDAGEHYVAGMLGFNNIPVAKMPDNWPGYDLMADFHDRQLRIQVKTFNKLTPGSWNAEFAPELAFDYLAIVELDGRVKAWLLPIEAVRHYARHPKPTAKNQNLWILTRDLHGDLARYRDNWVLEDASPTDLSRLSNAEFAELHDQVRREYARRQRASYTAFADPDSGSKA